MRLLHLTCFASLLLTSFAQNQIELFGHSISCIRKKCRKPANDISAHRTYRMEHEFRFDNSCFGSSVRALMQMWANRASN